MTTDMTLCLNLVEVLTKSSHLLERYGGHPMAVGIGLKTENIAAFYEEMDRDIRAQINPADLESFISYDGEADLGEFGRVHFIDWDQTRGRTRTVQVMIIGE